ncbi:serine hydrolase [Flavihumibacter petaseus]|uniref:Putative penicillin-binding protein n=1 Tax=Flavihumibacter petaseus NBRC 106054 TaxID=1220578 RepID=A0A0E9MXN5_9BACT|nr:serine hydrolase [Flavihumibacter petaseus]GAO42196.1 putative penicillin-binding protein [Flavihumibacter petaseus NBRC 106054]
MRIFHVFVLVFIGYTGTFAQYSPAVSRNFIKDSLDNYIGTAMKEWQVPGLSVAIVQQGKVIYLKGFGVRETGKPEKVDADTRFGIGSNTKAFTATALAMLEQKGVLSLDDKVQKWVPGFTQFDPWVAREATVRDLLCHRLGFETFQGDFMYFDSDLTYAETKEKFGKLKPDYGFRAKWGYTNAAFAVAGEVLEKASGLTWGSFLQQQIFQPLGMTRTLPYSKSIDTASNTARAHTVVEGQLKKVPYGHLDNLAPAGSIISSAKDLSHWATALMDSGRWNGTPVIPPGAIGITREPNSILGNGGSAFNSSHFMMYGLGWFLREYEGHQIVEHTGGVNGFVTSLTLIPDTRTAIIVLTNTDANGLYEALKDEIQDALLALPFRNYSHISYTQYATSQTRQQARLKAKRDTVAMKLPAAATPAAITGNYLNPVYGAMTIALENGKLLARFEHHKGRFAQLDALGGSRYLATFNDPLYGVRVWPFTIENGVVKNVEVNVNDFVEFTTYIFDKQ